MEEEKGEQKDKMKKEGESTPSYYTSRKEENINLCINGEDAEHAEEESWGIVIYEHGVMRELSL